MESITIKVDEQFAREIDKAMKPTYSTKTEFIREAIRDKIRKVNLAKIRPELLKNLGALRKEGQPQTTYEEERRIREEVGREIAREHGIRLD
ncbi:ribbon-helix-helix protein, CopG family [Candidatus Woesearchaeota archaeon]|nr:ribbon-helix-helix protein, CopG family [Candidatus Woesearchaeota archaeon]